MTFTISVIIIFRFFSYFDIWYKIFLCHANMTEKRKWASHILWYPSEAWNRNAIKAKLLFFHFNPWALQTLATAYIWMSKPTLLFSPYLHMLPPNRYQHNISSILHSCIVENQYSLITFQTVKNNMRMISRTTERTMMAHHWRRSAEKKKCFF